jgi:hypothetical protein
VARAVRLGSPSRPSPEKLPETRACAAFWPIRLRDPLPIIPIPVREPDPDVGLDLAAALHRVYDAARYANYIYQGDPQSGLRGDDAAWAMQFVPGAS